MGKLNTSILQGTTNKGNSVDTTSIQEDGTGTNPNEPQSTSDNRNPNEYHEMKDIQLIQGKNGQGEGNPDSQDKSPYETKGGGDPVNMATGEYIYEDKDFILPDMGGEYSLTRRYTGPLKKKPDRSLGKSWALSTDTFVTEEENGATVTMPDGKTAEYKKKGKEYINKKGGTKKHTLEKNESGYIFTDSTNHIKYYYDQNGRILKKTDKNGNTTEYRYNEYGIEKIILPTGYSITFMHENMKISSATDSTGRTVRYEYEKGLLTKVTRCDGTEIKYKYDGEENLKTVTDGTGCTYLENLYDENHRVKKQYIANGGIYSYTYDEINRTNSITEEINGSRTEYRYDKGYNITLINYPDGNEEKTAYDKYGNISEETDRCGAVTSYTYDIKGNLLTKKEPSGLITHYEYNGSEYEENFLAKIWDNAGRQTIYRHDEKGNITEERKLLNETGEESVTEYKYDGYGRMTQKNQNGRTTTYKYNGTFPYPVQITSPDGAETKKAFDRGRKTVGKNNEGQNRKIHIYGLQQNRNIYRRGRRKNRIQV